MGLNTKSILGVDITIDSKKDILEEIRKYFTQFSIFNFQFSKKKIKPFIIFTPNPEIINYAQKDDRFKQIVNTSQINIPDGSGVVWALKKLYRRNVKRLSGVDLMLDLCKLVSKRGLTIGLIGGRGGIAVETRECLLEKYPELKVEVLEAPEVIVSGIRYQGLGIKNKIYNNTNILNIKYLILNTEENQEEKTEEYFESLIKEIKQKHVDLLFVGLGFPKQEYFINLLSNEAMKQSSNRALIFMAVGGTFDYISGRVTRAPKLIRDSGLEWFYRLIREPWRLTRQRTGFKFFIKVLRAQGE